MTVECPSAQLLRRYAIGDLDDDASDDVERHLALCPACEDSLAQCDSAEDSLMRHLPLAGALAGEAQSEPPGWLDQLRNGPLEPATSAAAPSSRPAEPAVEFSSYELLGVLGHGGMGVVYRARHRQLGRLVALKVLSPRLMATAEARRRFEREIRVLGGLHHPGIVMATDANRIDGAAYLVMELIDGVDMARMVRDGGPLSVAEACEAGRQMALALAAAHRAGTVHRDIKPSNVMLDRLGRAKLLDFGLAHLTELSTESHDTSLGRLLGTLDYMAPEQAESEGVLDARADLFGLGATLFYLLSGQPPHGDHSKGSLLAQLRALVAEEPPRLRALRADVPPELDDFIARLLSRDPAKRPESAESVARTLSTWAGGDLAARVAELCRMRDSEAARSTNASEGEAATSSEIIAQRSLSELLGTGRVAVPEERTLPVTPQSRPEPPRRGEGRKIAAWVTAAAFAGAALFGVVILLKTPEGTLKIDSEVSHVSVELVNDQNQSHPLQIERGVNETTLRAGAYRVRFAGAHDGIAIEPDHVTLKRGEQTVARITRIPSIEKRPDGQTAKTGPESTPDDPFAVGIAAGTNGPVYQGMTEREWQQMFAVETSPSAKLDEAVALVTLAAEFAPKDRIQKILDVGTEIVHASFGDDLIDFALADPTKPPTSAPRWQIKKAGDRYISLPDARFNRRGGRVAVPDTRVAIPHDSEVREDIYSAYSRFQNLVNHDLRNIPAQPMAEALSAAVSQGPNPRAAFAASLLRLPARSKIQESPEAVQMVQRALEAPVTGIDWTAVRLLVLVGYVGTASQEQAQRIAGGADQLRSYLQASSTTSTTELLRSDLLEALKAEPKAGWPASVRRTIANLILDGSFSGPFGFYGMAHLEVFSPAFNGRAQELRVTYDPQSVFDLREKSRQFLDQWLMVANRYLQEHAVPPYGAGVREMAGTVDLALWVWSDGDNWPVEETVALFTKQLRSYYSDNPKDTTVQLASDFLPGTPAMLLTQIVRVTGELPDFVKKGYPKPRSVIAKWERFEASIKSNDFSILQDPTGRFQGLFNDDPYAVTKLAVEPPDPARQARGVFSPDQIFWHAADYNGVDPILLLALLADLTGNSPAQDARIAAFVKTWQPGSNMWRGLENLFASQLKARERTGLLLQKMVAKAKSPDLVNALRALNVPLSQPSASDAQRNSDAGQTGPASAAMKEPSRMAPNTSDAPVYQGTPMEEWQRIFAHETSPTAKLEEATALVTLAAEFPPKQHLAKVLDVGAEIVRASFGDNVIDFALADPTVPPTGAPRWPIKGQDSGDDGGGMRRGRRAQLLSSSNPAPRDDPRAAFARFQNLVTRDLRTLRAGLLADELSAAVRSGPNARGAFAASLLRIPTYSVIADPEASRVVCQRLDAPVVGLDWTALCLIVRLNYVRTDSAAQLQSLASPIGQLGVKLRAAAVSQTTNSMRSDLLDFLLREPREGWPPSVEKTIAELILDSIVREHRHFFEFVHDTPIPWTQTYDPKVGAERRRSVGGWLGPWLTVANAYLKAHTKPPFEFAERQVVASTRLPLLLYSKGDSWPVDDTAALLTQQLRAYYSDDPKGTTDQTVGALLPATPKELLTDIVRVTGDIPEFVKTGYPRLRTVAAKRQRLEQAVKSRDMVFMGQNAWPLAIDDPYGVIKLAIETAPPTVPQYLFGGTFSPQGILRMTCRESSDIDPLVYVAVLTDLAGRKPAWDDNIAELVQTWRRGSDTRVGLEYLVAGHTKASDHARQLLKAFAAKAKSPKLADAVRELNAALLTPGKHQ